MSIETLVNDYKGKTTRSRQMYEEALQVMPGGNSRTTTFFDPYPFYITRGAGPRIWDADGREYIDYVLSWGPLVLGHAPAAVLAASALMAGCASSGGSSNGGGSTSSRSAIGHSRPSKSSNSTIARAR